MILAALVSYAFAYSLARPLQQRNGALPVIWRALGVALVLTAPFGVPAVAGAHWTGRSLGSLIALGALGTGVAYAMLATAAGRLDATRAAANNYIIPVVSLLLGVGIRHEQVSPLSIVGAGVCLTGAWLIKPPRVRPAPAPATTSSRSLKQVLALTVTFFTSGDSLAFDAPSSSRGRCLHRAHRRSPSSAPPTPSSAA